MKLFKHKCKKSFTLVELSIVLLVLSILVGVLLTGRKIVDKANLQRVIFEIDYYKKALTLYRDTYDVYPGNMDQETCMKYAEFAQLNTDDANIEVGAYCSADQNSGKGRVVEGYASSRIMATNDEWRSYLNGMRFMQTAKIINEVSTTIADDELSDSSHVENGKGPQDEACATCISYEDVKRTQAKTSFDSSGAITIGSTLFNNDKEYSYDLNYIRGSNNSRKDSNGHEFYDASVRKILDSQNALFIYRNTPSSLDSSFGGGSSATGILTAELTNQLDIKIDDGRPGKGDVIALKNGYVKTSNLGEKDIQNICYNKIQSMVSDAYYVSSTDIKFGCNILVVLR